MPEVEARLIADAGARVLITSLTVQRNALQSKYPLPDLCPKTQAMIDKVLATAKR